MLAHERECMLAHADECMLAHAQITTVLSGMTSRGITASGEEQKHRQNKTQNKTQQSSPPACACIWILVYSLGECHSAHHMILHETLPCHI